MKILFGLLGHESNTFASGAGDFKSWAPNGWWAVGEELFTKYQDSPWYIGGMIKAAQEYDVELIPTVALENAGPTLTKETVDYAVGEVVRIAKERKGEYDGICIGLHGAGCAENTDDLEAYTLEKLREVVGPNMPITVSLDLHGNITEAMVELSNGLFGCKQYPHTDMADAGYLAMKTLIRMLRGEANYQTALVQLPLLVAPAVGCTFDEPMKSLTDYVAGYAAEHGLLDAAFFHGFPHADVPCAGASVVVVAEKGAKEAATAIATHIWENREHLKFESLAADVAVDFAVDAVKKQGTGYVVINEISDNPGAGAPGDGTHLLHEMISRDLPKTIFGYIYDPEIALLAHKVGVGGLVTGLLGGKTDKIHGAPVELLNAKVCALSDGNATFVTPMYEGMPVCYGKSARLRVGNVEIIVTELLNDQAFDDRPFFITGADINQYDVVCIKSENHFKSYFQPRAKAIVAADPPGIGTSNLSFFNYRNLRRPIYPIDIDARFSAK
ncbi:M81 family metallopeptidase [Sinorhizobium meliloti]|uniref:M81 family metallopeptidase n=1 Tax=Rhizobium meliloti TaxID=382 RepID=UPI002090E7AD|nr:M81 family metallopeptidase [Sinorhizobium meliloti]MCO5965415.1 M81 family metallopeptidase [Sinorhizobium meliloti]